VVDSSYPAPGQSHARRSTKPPSASPSNSRSSSNNNNNNNNAGGGDRDPRGELEAMSRDELLAIIEQTQEAYQRHVEQGEDEHVEGAGTALLALRHQLSRRSDIYEIGPDGQITFQDGPMPAGVTRRVLDDELTNLRAVAALLEFRGGDVTGVNSAIKHVQSLSPSSSSSPGSGRGGYGGAYGSRAADNSDGDDSGGGGEQALTLPELRERIRIVQGAVESHREAGETKHVQGASQVLQELQEELAARTREQ
jgi:hypothetical protein